jgi:hypothetical protein
VIAAICLVFFDSRPSRSHATLITIRKSAKWWALTQDERRTLFEEKSKHVAVRLKYLPGVARRLHHCRDLGERDIEVAKQETGAILGAVKEFGGVIRAIVKELEEVRIDVLTAMRKANITKS